MTNKKTLQELIPALRAFQEKKAEEVCVLQLDLSAGAFTDYILIASGTNARQVQAISDAVEDNLRRQGVRVNHIEGYNQAEWIMLDYVDFVVSVFSERARRYYDLERLWKSANRMTLEETIAAATKTVKQRAAKPAVVSAKGKVKIKAESKAQVNTAKSASKAGSKAAVKTRVAVPAAAKLARITAVKAAAAKAKAATKAAANVKAKPKAKIPATLRMRRKSSEA